MSFQISDDYIFSFYVYFFHGSALYLLRVLNIILLQKWTIFINYFICSRFSYEMEFVLIFWFVFRAKCAISGGGRAPNVQNNQFTLNCLLYYQIQNHARLFFFSCYLLLRMLFEVRWNGKNLVAVHVLCMYLYEYVLGNISCTRDDTRGRYLILMLCSQYSVLLW